MIFEILIKMRNVHGWKKSNDHCQHILLLSYLKTRNITKLTIYRLIIHTLLIKDQDTLIEQSLTLIQQSRNENLL